MLPQKVDHMKAEINYLCTHIFSCPRVFMVYFHFPYLIAALIMSTRCFSHKKNETQSQISQHTHVNSKSKLSIIHLNAATSTHSIPSYPISMPTLSVHTLWSPPAASSQKKLSTSWSKANGNWKRNSDVKIFTQVKMLTLMTDSKSRLSVSTCNATSPHPHWSNHPLCCSWSLKMSTWNVIKTQRMSLSSWITWTVLYS